MMSEAVDGHEDDGNDTIRLMRDNAETVEVIPQHITPRAIATLFQVRHIQKVVKLTNLRIII